MTPQEATAQLLRVLLSRRIFTITASNGPDQHIVMKQGVYGSGAPAVQFVDAVTAEPWGTLTVSLDQDPTLETGQFFAKIWSENADWAAELLSQLTGEGLLRIVEWVRVGPTVIAPRVEITEYGKAQALDAALALVKSSHEALLATAKAATTGKPYAQEKTNPSAPASTADGTEAAADGAAAGTDASPAEPT